MGLQAELSAAPVAPGVAELHTPLLLLWPPFFFVSPERLRLRRDRPSRTILIRKTIPSLIRNAIVLLEAFLQSYLSRAEAILVDRTSRYTSSQYR